ncbi:MAG: deoxyribose-phosphate aldolase [Actinomycetales bacterium]|nr:deoxyribose-phosphate aldolase [Actinomycetales bacterium]
MTSEPGLSRADYDRILQARLREPVSLRRALAGRRRRALLGDDANLLLLAADHTARGMLAVGSDPLAVADRYELLRRLVLGLEDPRVDGVLASADILEELALLGALEGRLAIGTMNRGGIIGASWELDDRMTAYDPAHVISAGLDGGKTLLRIDHGDAAVARTLEMVAQATTTLADAGVMHLIEPLPYRKREDGRALLDTSEEALVKVVAIASGLGSSSAFSWLKIPATANPALVASATTCPILLLGGDPGQEWRAVFDRWERALAVPNIRGLVPGRALLYPHELTVPEAVGRAAAIVHP